MFFVHLLFQLDDPDIIIDDQDKPASLYESWKRKQPAANADEPL